MTMRRMRYNVAASLDGYITGPDGDFDWIPNDPAVDFAGIFALIDTVVMGRLSYETVRRMGGVPWKPSARVYVVSRTLRQREHPDVTIVSEDPLALASTLRAEEGTGEIWLFGGGALFATLLAGGQVDSVEVTIVPILLGGGTPLLLAGSGRVPLTLSHTHVYPSGMVALHYDVSRSAT
jgi:dihydrofolate reductase